MQKIIGVINAISEISGKILMWLPWILMAVIMWEIVLRNIFNRPTVWAHELSIMTFAVLTIMGGAYTLRYKAHVNMDLFYTRLSPRGKAILDVLTFPFFLLFCVIILWLGWEFAFRSVKVLEISQSDWAPPLWPVKLAIPLGAFLLLLQGIGNFLSDLYLAITGKGVDE
ncbi:MAG: TRAP transporter small permease subunit [Deltaproteobacteria bacterium]|nr:TRAP transporter small permease subunit [Deltaproteobacteria bacterium]